MKSEPWVSPTGCVWKHDTLCRPTLALRRRPPGLERNTGCRRAGHWRVSCGAPALMKTYKREVQGNNACHRYFSTWKGTAGCQQSPCHAQSSQSTPASSIMSRRITWHRSVSASCIMVRMLLRQVVEYASSISSSSWAVSCSFSIVLPLSVSRFFPVRFQRPADRHATT